MNLIASNIRLQYNESGKAEIVLTTDTNRLDITGLKEVVAKDKKLACEIKQYRDKRSLDANALLWVICQKIAEVIRSTKEEVYKKAIREAGQFETLAVKEEAAEQFIKVWNSRGLGWYAEEMDSKLEGCKKIIAYYGSSCYDTRSMSILIDYIVDEAKRLNIELMPEAEIESLKREWDKRK